MSKFEVSVTGLGMFYADNSSAVNLGLVLSVADALSGRALFSRYACDAMEFCADTEENGTKLTAQAWATEVGRLLLGI
jgi:hypothetical protein